MQYTAEEGIKKQAKKNPTLRLGFLGCGGRGRSRTCDRLVRSQVLYPAELRAHIDFLPIVFIHYSHVYSLEISARTKNRLYSRFL